MRDRRRGGLLRRHGRPGPRRGTPPRSAPRSGVAARAPGGPAGETEGDAVRGGQPRTRGARRTGRLRRRRPRDRQSRPRPRPAPDRSGVGVAAQGTRGARGPPGRLRARAFAHPASTSPGTGASPRYRDELAAAGYHYVSDASRLGTPLAGPGGAGALLARHPPRGGQLPASAALLGGGGGRPTLARAGGALLPLLRLRRHPARAGCRPLAHAGPATARAAAGSRRSCGASSSGSGARPAPMSPAEFDTYFHDRASRFAAFYRSEPVARAARAGPAVRPAARRRRHRRRPRGTTRPRRGMRERPALRAPRRPGRARHRDRSRPGHGGARPRARPSATRAR